MKLFYVLIALLFAGMFVGLVEARSGTFVISPGGEAIEKIQLSPPDSVFGNLSVSGGSVKFFITNPSNGVIYQNLKTSGDQFNFTADANGTYQMHFVNEYQSGNVSVNLSYGVNFFIFVSEDIHISTSFTISAQTTTSSGIIITRLFNPYIAMNINPPGFPVVGQYWQISVFSQNQGLDGVTYLSPLPNATILVRIVIGNQTKVYNSTTNEEGQLEFQFLPEYSDISFQASWGGNQSDIYAFTQQTNHYVSAAVVDLIFTLSLIASGITALSVAVLHIKTRIRAIFSWLIGAVLLLSLFELVISSIAKFFWLTPWGYDENVFGFLPWTYLEYAAVGSIVLYAFLTLAAFCLERQNPSKEAPPK